VGALTLPASGDVYVDANAVIYAVEKWEQAARLRAVGLRTPDALHAATALATGCVPFVTNDPRFRRVLSLPLALLSEIATP
jgi:predicted nucleic acid-binding protein